MKKLLSIAALFFAMVCFTSCGNETANYYTQGFIGVSGSSDTTIITEMANIQGAFEKEFGTEASFIINGNPNKCDKDVIKRFEDVVEVIDLNYTFSGNLTLTYGISRGTETIVQHTWGEK
ncbi:MAG: hypothetical protein Q4D14_05080 [Bacteroidales bacterium]|nr:hypothetical protein [Bacteroidales bacterium]